MDGEVENKVDSLTVYQIVPTRFGWCWIYMGVLIYFGPPWALWICLLRAHELRHTSLCIHEYRLTKIRHGKQHNMWGSGADAAHVAVQGPMQPMGAQADAAHVVGQEPMQPI